MKHQCNYSILTTYSPDIGSGRLALPATRSMRILRKKDLAKKLSCSESTMITA